MISFLAMCLYSRNFLTIPHVTDEEFSPVTPEPHVKDEEFSPVTPEPHVKDEDAPVPGQ